MLDLESKIEAIPEEECRMEIRGGRKGPSRMTSRDPRPTRTLTVIGGPYEGETILYTAFGGPVAPREPFEFEYGTEDYKASVAFWSQHALSR